MQTTSSSAPTGTQPTAPTAEVGRGTLAAAAPLGAASARSRRTIRGGKRLAPRHPRGNTKASIGQHVRQREHQCKRRPPQTDGRCSSFPPSNVTGAAKATAVTSRPVIEMATIEPNAQWVPVPGTEQAQAEDRSRFLATPAPASSRNPDDEYSRYVIRQYEFFRKSGPAMRLLIAGQTRREHSASAYDSIVHPASSRDTFSTTPNKASSGSIAIASTGRRATPTCSRSARTLMKTC